MKTDSEIYNRKKATSVKKVSVKFSGSHQLLKSEKSSKHGKRNECLTEENSDETQFYSCVQDTPKIDEGKYKNQQTDLSIKFQIHIVPTLLFFIGLGTRLYKLDEPRSIVFDELHYGKYISLYMNKVFFFDSHPPLGKQLIALVAYLVGFNGQFKFEKIGSKYDEDVPLFTLRFIPAICGSLIMPTAYHLMLELGLTEWTATIAGFLLLCDNALLTQSRFVLMESILLFFAVFGILCVLRFKKSIGRPYSISWWFWLVLAFASLTCSLCVKFVGIFSYVLGIFILAYTFWELLCDRKISCKFLATYFLIKSCVVFASSVSVYLLIFYIHLSYLTKAGPHDSVMTSAFQASLEGGLASITKGQPLEVGHGSQITLRHTYGRTCWLHSHPHVYPLRYPDKRGSSHQQQVTCYSFKDVNNWWIVKRPGRNDLMVSHPVDAIKHGDIIQLVHGITSRALNSHDVAAPMSPQNQEVSCYVDYNVSMPAQNLWKVEIVNKEQVGNVWHTIQSQIRLIHLNSSQVLKFSGRQLPEWGFNQHEIVTDRVINQPDSIWNVEEHRYTKSMPFYVGLPHYIFVVQTERIAALLSDQRVSHKKLENLKTQMNKHIIDWFFTPRHIDFQYRSFVDFKGCGHRQSETKTGCKNPVYNVFSFKFECRGSLNLIIREDQKERERDMVNAEMIPTQATTLSFWEKLLELQYKMLFSYQEPLQSHMYSSEPLEWPLLTRTTAYWVSSDSNAQVHLLGNIVIWYSGAIGFFTYVSLLVFYMLRRRRNCFDLPNDEWKRFCTVGQTLMAGYLLHYIPYFFMDRTLFLHHYLPAFVFKALLLAALLEHSSFLFGSVLRWKGINGFLKFCVLAWCLWIVWIFKKLSVLSYGTTALNAQDLIRLRWKDTWHFILHKE